MEEESKLEESRSSKMDRFDWDLLKRVQVEMGLIDADQ
jgi:hypothetical protein